jgi:hypothetical protein
MGDKPKVCFMPVFHQTIGLPDVALYIRSRPPPSNISAKSSSWNLDLHEPHRTLASLGPYDHLRRLTRLCYVHLKRNIHDCKVSPDVRVLMGSLLCITHPNWDQTIEKIKTMGGKAAASESSVI